MRNNVISVAIGLYTLSILGSFTSGYMYCKFSELNRTKLNQKCYRPHCANDNLSHVDNDR